MSNPAEINPRESLRATLAYELRRHREKSGLSQEQLAKELFSTRSSVQAYEALRNPPDEEFCTRADVFFDTGLHFQTLWYHSLREHIAEWFREYLEEEPRAAHIRAFHNQSIPGLLQTEGYIRARAKHHEDLDAFTSDRLRRAEILTRPDPAHLWAVIDEAALRRPVGDIDAMRVQLQHLLDMGMRRNIFIQIVPESVGTYPGLDGPLLLMDMPDGRRIGYIESHLGGRRLDEPGRVAELTMIYERIRVMALSVVDSRAFIRRLLENLDDPRMA